MCTLNKFLICRNALLDLSDLLESHKNTYREKLKWPIVRGVSLYHPEGTSNNPDNFQQYQKIRIVFYNGGL